MPNLELVRKDDVSSFRKIAIGPWRTAYDPSVYGTMELRNGILTIKDWKKLTELGEFDPSYLNLRRPSRL